MASTTPNIGLTLPTGTEGWKRSVINGNFTILDTKIGAVGNTPLQTQINTLSSQIEYIALTVTKESGASAIAINARKFGRMCVVSGTIDFASTPSSWTNYDIATITYGNTAVTSTIYVTALVYGNSGKIATIEINAGENKLIFRPLGNSGYSDLNGRFSIVFPTN